MKNPKLISLVLLLTFCIAANSKDKISDSTLFSVEQLHEDVDFWTSKLKSIHPILFQYNSPQEFNNHFEILKNQITKPMTQLEFYRLIASSNAFIKCAHSQIRPSVSMEAKIMNDSSLIPVDIQWYQNEAYVTYNYTSNSKLAPGTRIVKINGVDISEVYDKCEKLMPRDGSNGQYARHWVNEQFYYYYHLIYDFSEIYQISIQNDSHIEEVEALGMSIQEMNHYYDNNPPNFLEKSTGISFHFIDSLDAAYLQVGSFSDSDIKRENGMKFKKCINRIFERIDSSAVNNLIVDMQGNAGGNPSYSLYLLRYVMKVEFVFKEQIRKLKDSNESETDKRTKETLFSDGTKGSFKPFKKAFKGKVYVLQDGGTVSAGTEFTYVIKRYNRGPIIGEESGGNPGIMTGYWFFSPKKTLPNTQLRYGVAHRTVLMNKDYIDKGTGLLPDHTVELTISDYLRGYDRAMHYTAELIESQKLHTTN